mmetsp:Transcript_25085/g.81106  ORF Transcript_25085/g.81106 Transcript_25085/m.81106 type:complete len:162 (-) Transcript_25085:104-589(-)
MLRQVLLGRRVGALSRRLTVKSPKKKDEPLTREQVEAIAERARTEQRIWDAERKIFGGGISLGHPFFFLLAGGAVLLHYANARRDEKLENDEEHLARLQRKKTQRDLDARDVDDVIALKRHQLQLWHAKTLDDDPAVSVEARAREAKLQNELAELEFKRVV